MASAHGWAGLRWSASSRTGAWMAAAAASACMCAHPCTTGSTRRWLPRRCRRHALVVLLRGRRRRRATHGLQQPRLMRSCRTVDETCPGQAASGVTRDSRRDHGRLAPAVMAHRPPLVLLLVGLPCSHAAPASRRCPTSTPGAFRPPPDEARASQADCNKPPTRSLALWPTRHFADAALWLTRHFPRQGRRGLRPPRRAQPLRPPGRPTKPTGPSFCRHNVCRGAAPPGICGPRCPLGLKPAALDPRLGSAAGPRLRCLFCVCAWRQAALMAAGRRRQARQTARAALGDDAVFTRGPTDRLRCARAAPLPAVGTAPLGSGSGAPSRRLSQRHVAPALGRV